VKIKELIVKLIDYYPLDSEVKIYDADSKKVEKVTGFLFDPANKIVTLQSDERW
jgi:hypothetical protein